MNWLAELKKRFSDYSQEEYNQYKETIFSYKNFRIGFRTSIFEKPVIYVLLKNNNKWIGIEWIPENKDTLLFLDSIKNKSLMPCCANIDFAKPIVEAVFKNG